MKKSLLALAAVAAISMLFMGCPNSSQGGSSDPTSGSTDPYANIEGAEYLTLDELGSGWSAEYNASTQTITWTGAYGGKGWWFGSKDASDYTTLNVVFSDATGADPWLQLVVQYNDDSIDNSTANGVFTKDSDGVFVLSCELDSTGKADIMQAYIQGKATDNTATIKYAYFK